MTPAELARGRSLTWGLVGQLLLRGPTAGVQQAVLAVPSLAPFVAGQSDDELAAEHYAALERAVPPYASLFVGDGLLGGETAQAAREAMVAVGFLGSVADVEPDHLGVLCLALAHLGEAEAQAVEDGEHAALARVVAAQSHLLRAQVLPWAPPLLVALRLHGGLYGELAGLIAELIGSHGVALDEAAVEAVNPLDDPKTGLGELADWLVTPRLAGWWLTSAAITRWGQTLQLPLGFGPRRRMASVLLRGAAGHSQIVALAAVMRREQRVWRGELERLGELGLPVRAWLGRVEVIEAVARRLEEAPARLAEV